MRLFRSVLIVADDFTGASDAAAQFSKLGLRAISTLNLDLVALYLQTYSVVAIDTESRFDEPSEAYRKLYSVGLRIKDYRDVLLYKKVDSALRGNIAEEVKGLFDAINPNLVVFAPAYPKQGRTTVNGMHLVDGVPVDQTFFSRDPRAPVKSSHIPLLLSKVFNELYTHVFLEDLRSKRFMKWLESYRVVSFDVGSDEDLKIIVEALANFSGRILWVGSAGLAEALAHTTIIGSSTGKPVLLIIGSLNDVTRRQLKNFIKEFDCRVIKVGIRNLLTDFEAEYLNIVEQVEEALRAGIDIVLTTSYDRAQVDEGVAVASELGLPFSEVSARVADGVGRILSRIVEGFGAQAFSGILATGGDIAVSLVRGIGAESLEVVGETEPGIPILRHGHLCIVTKAGGFGGELSILRIVARLKGVGLC